MNILEKIKRAADRTADGVELVLEVIAWGFRPVFHAVCIASAFLLIPVMVFAALAVAPAAGMVVLFFIILFFILARASS